jgi:hypothetical protein
MPILQAEGSRSALAYIEEGDGFGVTPPSSAGWDWRGFRFNTETLGKDINVFESQEIRSDRMTAAIIRGNRNPNGDVTFELGRNSHNLLLRHLLGGEWTTSGTLSPYTHTIQGSSSLPAAGLSVVKAFTDIPSFLVYSGCRVDSVAFDIPQEGFIGCTASLVSKAEATPTATRPYPNPLVYPAGDPYESVLTVVHVQDWSAGGSYTWNAGTQVGIVGSGRFTVSNGLDPNSFVLGSTSRYSIPAGRRRIEGNFNLLLLDTSFYEDYVNGQAIAIRIVMTDGTYSHTWTLPNVRYAGPKPTPQIQGEQGIRYDLPFRAIRHENLGYDVHLSVVADEQVVKY